MNQKEYLKRIGFTSIDNVSLINLTALQNAHLQHIPFENLDVIRKVPIYLNLERIYEKVVHHSRGGYCYELNGLFQSLLSGLGYDAHLVAATVYRGSGDWAKEDTHAAIIVHLDQPYLVDVGFGAASPRHPIALTEEKQKDTNGTYWITPQDNGLLYLRQSNNEGERTLYRFRSDKRALSYFHEGCIFNQVSTDSSFTHTDIATIATKTGRITLSDQTVTVVNNGETTISELTLEEKNQLLYDSFNILL